MQGTKQTSEWHFTHLDHKATVSYTIVILWENKLAGFETFQKPCLRHSFILARISRYDILMYCGRYRVSTF